MDDPHKGGSDLGEQEIWANDKSGGRVVVEGNAAEGDKAEGRTAADRRQPSAVARTTLATVRNAHLRFHLEIWQLNWRNTLTLAVVGVYFTAVNHTLVHEFHAGIVPLSCGR